MLKKTVTYTDFNGDEVSEDLFFHLSKAELVELELSREDGLSESLRRIVEAEDGKAIIAEFKSIILGSYGKRSPDGKRFIKNQQLREEFESSEAYSVLFMELVTNTQSAIDFVNGIVPVGMVEEATKTLERANLTAVPNDEESKPEIITRAKMITMSSSELQRLGERLASREVVIDDSVEGS